MDCKQSNEKRVQELIRKRGRDAGEMGVGTPEKMGWEFTRKWGWELRRRKEGWNSGEKGKGNP